MVHSTCYVNEQQIKLELQVQLATFHIYGCSRMCTSTTNGNVSAQGASCLKALTCWQTSGQLRVKTTWYLFSFKQYIVAHALDYKPMNLAHDLPIFGYSSVYKTNSLIVSMLHYLFVSKQSGPYHRCNNRVELFHDMSSITQLDGHWPLTHWPQNSAII